MGWRCCQNMENPMIEPTEFKLIVAFSKSFDDDDLFTRVMYAMSDNEFAGRKLSIVTGVDSFADMLALHFAIAHDLPIHQFPVNSSGLGKKAQYKRNTQMGTFADALLVFTDGSKSTKHIIDYMQQLKKPVHLIKYNP